MMSRTKASLFWLLSLSLLPALAVSCAAQTRQRTVEAGSFPGADIGAKINAADRALGSAAGEIVARGGGRITTQIVVSGGHTLRLMPGTYAPVTAEIPILLKPGARLVGASWEAIVQESTAPNQFTVVSAFNNAHRNGSADSDIQVSNLQIRGANPGFNSAQQAVSMGNCTGCTVDHVFINSTRSIGIQLGGASFEGHFAENSKVVNCQFTRVASQGLALVNGRNITFENNRFLAPGQQGGPGSSPIDLEPNDANDHLENVIVRNNTIDARDSEVATAGNGIIVQSGSGTPHVGPILVEGNTIIGGSFTGVITNKISNGIYVFGPTMKDVTIRNNRVTRTGQSGISIQGTRITVQNNTFTDVGGGGLPGFKIEGLTDSQVTGNSFTNTGTGPADPNVAITGPLRNNVIRNNPGFNFPPGIR